MVALISALRRLHVPQKPVHLGHGQPAVRTNGTVTGDGGEKSVSEFLDDGRRTEIVNVLQQALHHGLHRLSRHVLAEHRQRTHGDGTVSRPRKF